MITKSEEFGNCGRKIHSNFGENAFDKVYAKNNYRIASLEYNTETNELTINQYPDVSKTVILGTSDTYKNVTSSHKDVVQEILDWANISIDEINNLNKDRNYVIYNANNPESERYLYYSYNKAGGNWITSALQEGDEFYNLKDGIKYRYIDNMLVNSIDVNLTATNTMTNGISTGITLEVSPTTGSSVHLDLVDEVYAGLMPPEYKQKLDTIDSKIGAKLELGNPNNGIIPLYLKTESGDVLSMVNLDEDDYITDIVASIALDDDPDNEIFSGDRILTFTLTNSTKIVVNLENWFIKYSGEDTEAISTDVTEDKIKSTLILNPDADNLSAITSTGLLTRLNWGSEETSVKFLKGLKVDYDAVQYSGYIYFTSDTKEVIVDGVAYGIDLTADDLNLVSKLEKDENIPGRIIVTKSNGTAYNIDIPTVSTTSDGLITSTDKAKLDNVEDRAQVNIIEGIKINGIAQNVDENKSVSLNVYDKSEVNSLIANRFKYKGECPSIGNLPVIKDIGDSYKITEEKIDTAIGATVYWNGDSWVTFTGNLDLSQYVTVDDLEDLVGGLEIGKELDKKVDKVEGSSLVPDTEIEKLGYLDSYIKSISQSVIEGKINLDVITKDVSNKGRETVGHIVLPESSSNNNGLMSSEHYNVINALNLNSTYLDKDGTPSHIWQLSKGTGPKIKNSSGQFELRNSTDDTYADLTVKNLVITGNVTQEGESFITDAETIKVTDNTITLNNGETGAGVTRGYAGLEIDRGTSPTYKIVFDESDDRFKAGEGEDTWPIMLRDNESTLTNQGVLAWDATTKRAKTIDLNGRLDGYFPLAGNTQQTPITGTIYGAENKYLSFMQVDSTDPFGHKQLLTLDKDSSTVYTDLNIQGTLYVTGSISANGYRVWTENNDGHNSGLDADTLDGKHASEFALTTAIPTQTSQLTNDSGFITNSALNNYVTLDTAQTISGAKTFSAAVTSTQGFFDTSDRRLKNNIKEISLNSEKIKLYEFDKLGIHGYGVIAQEVEKLYPSCVKENNDGYRVVNYDEVLVIKCAELEKENKELKDRLDNLEKLLANKSII